MIKFKYKKVIYNNVSVISLSDGSTTLLRVNSSEKLSKKPGQNLTRRQHDYYTCLRQTAY